MKEEYKILESPRKEGILTIKMEDDKLSFNHSNIHKKEVYEDFDFDDLGFEMINGFKIFHLNGHIITPKEYKFVKEVFDEL